MTFPAFAATEDFRTYWVDDDDNDMNVYPKIIEMTTMRRDVDSSVFKDYEASHFGDFVINFTFNITAQGGTNSHGNVMSLTNIAAPSVQDILDAGVGVMVRYFNSSGSTTIFLDQRSGTDDIDSFVITVGTTYYATFTRTASSTYTLELFSDEARTSSVDVMTVDYEGTAYRYIAFVGSRESGTTPTWSATVSEAEIISPAAGCSFGNLSLCTTEAACEAIFGLWAEACYGIPVSPLFEDHVTLEWTNDKGTMQGFSNDGTDFYWSEDEGATTAMFQIDAAGSDVANCTGIANSHGGFNEWNDSTSKFSLSTTQGSGDHDTCNFAATTCTNCQDYDIDTAVGADTNPVINGWWYDDWYIIRAIDSVTGTDLVFHELELVDGASTINNGDEYTTGVQVSAGTLQGLDYADGYAYWYGEINGAATSPKHIIEFELDDPNNTAKIKRVWAMNFSTEAEGMWIDDTDADKVFFGDISGNMRSFSKKKFITRTQRNVY